MKDSLEHIRHQLKDVIEYIRYLEIDNENLHKETEKLKRKLNKNKHNKNE